MGLMTKRDMRASFKKIRSGISHELAKEKNRLIRENLFTIQAVRDAKTIMTYLSYGDEADTWEMIKQFFFMGKKVCAPAVVSDGYMEAAFLSFAHDVKAGFKGILEPKSQKWVSKDQIDVCLIPGLGFSKDGDRMGYGKGFYDRFLSGYNGVKIGIAFEEQIVQRIPADSHDIKMDLIVTDKRVMVIGKEDDF